MSPTNAPPSVLGLSPCGRLSTATQLSLALLQLRAIPAPLDKYIYLARLRLASPDVFYALVLEHLMEVCPLIYTPVVGTACLQFSRIHGMVTTPGTPNGLYISYPHLDRLEDVIAGYKARLSGVDPVIAVITDGSRILGLGDLGVNGMGIPLGKLQLYVAAAGLDPSRTLPICVDLGTDTAHIRDDPMYLGWRKPRPTTAEFHRIMDRVLAALHATWPNMLIQFEDFSTDHAFALLEHHRRKYPSFNDDIQGTGAVVLAGFINAVRIVGIPVESHRVVFLGAGSAAVGVAHQLVDYFVQHSGMSLAAARKCFYLVDSKGLVTADRGDVLAEHKVEFARNDNNGTQCHEFLEAVEYIHPTAIIGLSSQAGGFDSRILQRMAELNDRPIVFPLSNPATNAECTFTDAMQGTANKVVFASGTAFPAYTIPDTKQVKVPGQGNNMYIFPGLGLGAILAKATQVTDAMVYASAIALANSLTAEERSCEDLYPALERIREISVQVAVAVIRQALKDGVCASKEVKTIFDVEPSKRHEDMWEQWVAQSMWVPKVVEAEVTGREGMEGGATSVHARADNT